MIKYGKGQISESDDDKKPEPTPEDGSSVPVNQIEEGDDGKHD